MDSKSADFPAGLQPSLTPGAQITGTGPQAWRLLIPAGPAGQYRLAQLDDYSSLPRKAFRWQQGSRLYLEARASQPGLPGTWGFGLWNDPFSMGILGGVGDNRFRALLRLPVLPDTAWFFYASPPSYLSLRDDLPAQGWLAAVFRARPLPGVALIPAVLGLPLLLFPAAVRKLRRLLRKLVQQDAVVLQLDQAQWHSYELCWQASGVTFQVDGREVLQTSFAPLPRLGLVIWIDNQYMAASPSGRIGYGALENPEPAWIEIRAVDVLRG